MRKLFAWLGAAMLVVCSSSSAFAGEPLKPYVVLILDTSGSMNAPTGSGPPSCGGSDTRIEHATCAINRITNSYGDMVFALGRFRETVSGTFTTSCDANGDLDGNRLRTFPTPSGGDQCSSQGVYCGNCDESTGLGDLCNSNADCISGTCSNGRCAGFGTCTTANRELEMLSGLVDGNNQLAAGVTDRSCSSCSMPTGGAITSANEIWGVSPVTFTPLAAVLNGAKAYWLGSPLASDGTTVIWPSSAPGFAPIFNDTEKTKFLPAGCNSSPTCTTNCCASQCRPYITILLTDGAETCTSFTNTTTAASSLLRTDIGGRRYRVETKPIGFGIAPGNSQIEAIAQAGGASNLPGSNEGFYASDEAGLQLAISSILADAIKTERCNAADDDCDTLIDEDFPTVGNACTNGASGSCRVDGALECRADETGVRCDAGLEAECANAANGTACTVVNTSGTNAAGTCTAGVCNVTPQTEVCNSIDDDCDGKVDENLGTCSCAPQGEACDNDDDDCDGRIDEGITLPCGIGACAGTRTCTAGVFSACPTGGPEVCDGVDNNCDGIRDGLQAECSTMAPLPPENFPIDDPRNNPGHPSNNPVPENLCRPGQKVCPANVGPPNQFGTCQNEIKPCNGAPGTCLDLCDNIDQDCDNAIDENFVPADCSTNCGIGTTSCVNGTIQCTATQATNDTTCNNIDDDCDTMIDEDWVSPGACGTGVVCMGMVECINGMETCVGAPIQPESCDCDDDDCDNIVDEGNLCAAGATCTNCQCALPCGNGELFPCPTGKFCKDDFCLADPCFGVVCDPVNGDKHVCQQTPAGNAYTCVSVCSVSSCSPGEVCIGATGECKPDNCQTFPERCTENQNCIAGECVTNLCKNVTCGTGEYCVGGQCFGSCADVECPAGQRCRLGACEADPCNGPCPFGQVCVTVGGQGACVSDPCPFTTCPGGQVCDPNVNGGSCVDDPCVGTTCPNPGEVCKGSAGGTCFDPSEFLPDGGAEERVTTGGGGGCATGGGGGSGGAGLFVGMLVALALGLGTRTRRRARLGGRS